MISLQKPWWICPLKISGGGCRIKRYIKSSSIAKLNFTTTKTPLAKVTRFDPSPMSDSLVALLKSVEAEAAAHLRAVCKAGLVGNRCRGKNVRVRTTNNIVSELLTGQRFSYCM